MNEPKEDTDWKVGDVAVCIWKKPADDGLELGRYYTVTGVLDFPFQALGLQLKELPSQRFGLEGGWLANRFRKVRPAADKEFVERMRELLHKTPSTVDA